MRPATISNQSRVTTTVSLLSELDKIKQTGAIIMGLLLVIAVAMALVTMMRSASAGTGLPAGLYAYPQSQRLQDCNCGVRGGQEKYSNVKIVNGTEAEIGEFPWRVALIEYTDNGYKICAGAILSPEWVLTAAHCTIGGDVDRMWVFAGDHDLTMDDEVPSVRVKVAEVIEHEQYVPSKALNDIALLRLKDPLPFRWNIQPVCVPYKIKWRRFDWETVTASGWGANEYHGAPQITSLKKVDLMVVPLGACRSWNTAAEPAVVTERNICAYGMPLNSESTCQGDSGGSLDYKDPQTGRYYALGVVNWAIGCAGELHPTVFAAVTKYVDWIDFRTGTHFCG